MFEMFDGREVTPRASLAWLLRLARLLWRILRVLAQVVWSVDEVAAAVRKVFRDDDEEDGRRK